MFNLFLGKQPQKFLANSEKELRLRIWKKLDELKENPFPSDVKRVEGKKEKSFRVRVGGYRVEYIVLTKEKEIIIFEIEKRQRAY